jgi:COP9 signalosome complex subunit 12
MGRYEGCMESPWDDISIQYVLVCTHVAKKRYVEAFKEESQLVSSVIWFFFFGKSQA